MQKAVRDSLQPVGHVRETDLKENAAFPRWFSLKKEVRNGMTSANWDAELNNLSFHFHFALLAALEGEPSLVSAAF